MLQFLTILANATKARRETLNGDSYLVAPMVMLKAEAFPTSDNSEEQINTLYTSELLNESVPDWEKVPIVVYHPKKDGKYVLVNELAADDPSKIGFMKDVQFTDPDLKGEGWFHEEKTKKADHNLHDALVNGRTVEVSTGMYGPCERVTGEYKGKKYHRKPTKLYPDHMAVLPNGKGACGVECGCGLLRNSNKELEMDKNGKITFLINAKIGWDEADRTTLAGLPDAKVDSLYNTASKPAPTPILNPAPAPAPTPPPAQNLDQLLNSASPDLRSLMNTLINDAKVAKEQLINTIKANPNNQFSQEWLATQPVEVLRGMTILGGTPQGQTVISQPVPILTNQAGNTGNGQQAPPVLLAPGMFGDPAAQNGK